MSPEPTVTRAPRVLRGDSASAAPSTAFPLIESVPTPPRGTTRHGAAHGAVPQVTAPTVDHAELDRLRLEAAARGYEDGIQAGRDEALREVRAASQQLLERLAHAVGAYEARRAQSFAELTGDVARFAFATVESMLGRELALAESPVQDAIRHALSLAPERIPATVLVNPADLDAVASIGDIAGAREVMVVADEAVEPGGCVVRADECEVDAQVGSALERLRAMLLDEMPAGEELA